MDIEINRGTVTDTAATHIRLISDYQSSCNGIYSSSRLFVMVSDSCNNGRHIFRRHSHLIQNTKSHHSPTLGVVDAVHHIAYIVHETGDTSQFHLMRIIS